MTRASIDAVIHDLTVEDNLEQIIKDITVSALELGPNDYVEIMTSLCFTLLDFIEPRFEDTTKTMKDLIQ